MSGAYVLTFEADSECKSLPAGVRERSYSALLGAEVAELTGARFAEPLSGYPAWNVLYVREAGDVATLYFSDPEIWELIDDDSYLVLLGSATGVVDRTTSRLVMSGTFRYCRAKEPDPYPECAVPEITCLSSHHTVTVSRN